MDALRDFLMHPLVLLISFVGAICTIWETAVRYQFGWKHGIIHQLRLKYGKAGDSQRESETTLSQPVSRPAVTGHLPELLARAQQDVRIAGERELSAAIDRIPRVGDQQWTDHIKRALVHRYDGMGDDARYHYFEDRRRASLPSKIHRFAFVDLAQKREFAALAEGLKEWCRIGFDTLVNRTPVLQCEDTMDRLYAALLKRLQEDDLLFQGVREFAYAWAELVRQYRADGY